MTVKYFDALRFTDDTPGDVYVPYVAALNNHRVAQLAIDNQPLYATTDEILTAMLQVRGTGDTNLPLALGEDPDSPELFLASITPYGLDLMDGECALRLHLDNSAGNLGNIRFEVLQVDAPRREGDKYIYPVHLLQIHDPNIRYEDN